ncbi:DUF6973 domain-containing protein [Dyadobacter soli]|uniref:DUF6973 domain-containing protein n=1 Tax=Dyadobacter soli TaxID=659014 RepID=UPI00115F8B75|nr:hypothetical protein [Dyadobacter soli]
MEDEIVVAPVLSGNFLGCRIKDGRKDKRKPDEESVAGRIQRNLVVRKVRGKIEAMEMRTVFDGDYEPTVKNGKVDPSNFEGKVYFFDMSGKLVNGLIYEEGKQVATFGPNKGGRTSDMVEVCTDWYHQGCVAGYGCSGWVYQETTCEMVYIGQSSGGTGTVWSNSLDVALTGGSDVLFEAMMQLPYVSDLWANLNNTEKEYFENRKWLIPQAAFARGTAIALTFWFYCQDGDNGNWNAFKHAVWTAILCMQFGTSTTLQITNNHELESPPNQQEMDLHNNGLGIQIYKSISASIASLPANSPGLKIALIVDNVMAAIKVGLGKRILPEEPLPGQTQTMFWTNGTNRCH